MSIIQDLSGQIVYNREVNTNPVKRLEIAGKKLFPEGFVMLYRGGGTLEQLCVFLWDTSREDSLTVTRPFGDGFLELQHRDSSNIDPVSLGELFLLAAEALHKKTLSGVAATLHREICQSLTAAKLEIDLLRLSNTQSEEFDRIHDVIADSVHQVRALMESLPAESPDSK